MADYEPIKWWAYRHTNGTIQLKRYFSPLDLQDARESPFVRDMTGPYPADGRDEAMKIAEERLAV